MKHLDEQEMLIQYSEMTAFDFNSEEFQRIREDYIECKNLIQKILLRLNNRFRPIGA